MKKQLLQVLFLFVCVMLVAVAAHAALPIYPPTASAPIPENPVVTFFKWLLS